MDKHNNGKNRLEVGVIIIYLVYGVAGTWIWFQVLFWASRGGKREDFFLGADPLWLWALLLGMPGAVVWGLIELLRRRTRGNRVSQVVPQFPDCYYFFERQFAGLESRLWTHWRSVYWLVLGTFVILIDGLPPVLIAAPASVIGWLLAEISSFHGREERWQVVRGYIDWRRYHGEIMAEARRTNDGDRSKA